MRPIDADALRRSLSDWQFESFSTVGHEKEYSLIDAVLVGIGAAPTIDAVPVVRRRECSFSTGFGDSVYCMKFIAEVYADAFCSYGSRRPGGASE